ncbi:YraN family protein [Halothiobacillus sp. DCM-1]|uniref:YraN family protein n=1 Tax=Halothiobacillus sp. DCM-1 TaxID=3112558 RepID=UPI00324425F5
MNPASEPSLAVGHAAEREAEAFLRTKGLKPLGRNLRAGRGEIDLLMQAGKTLVFVEVRARKSGAAVAACETITAKKRQRVVQTANQWLQQHPEWQQYPCRFDVVAITLNPADGQQNTVHWLPDAFDGSAT